MSKDDEIIKSKIYTITLTSSQKNLDLFKNLLVEAETEFGDKIIPYYWNLFVDSRIFKRMKIMEFLLKSQRFSLMDQKQKDDLLNRICHSRVNQIYNIVNIMILQGANPLAKDYSGNDSFQNFIRISGRKALDKARYWLDNKWYNVEGKLSKELRVVCRNGSLKACRLLIEYGADPHQIYNLEYDNGNTIHYAVESRNTHLVVYLYELGVNIHFVSRRGYSVLHLSSDSKTTKITELAIKCQVDVNRQNNIGNTALHIAARGNRTNIMKSLLNGIDSRDANRRDKHINDNRRDKHINDNRRNKYTNDNRRDKHTNKYTNEDTNKYTNEDTNDNRRDKYTNKYTNEDTNEDVNDRYDNYDPKIHNNSADTNTQNDDGNTALHIAGKYNHVRAIGILLANGADPRLLNKEEKTALMLAKDNGRHNAVKLLETYPLVVSLRTLCLRVIKSSRTDVSDWPPLMFLWPDEIEETKERYI